MRTHILNGDALAGQFPDTISGQRIIMREMLIEGPVDTSDMTIFYKKRSRFIEQEYNATPEEYEQGSQNELQKIASLSSEEEVYLWFEDDLFCQTNFWFCCFLLHKKQHAGKTYLVRPGEDRLQYGFGGLSKQELNTVYNTATLITPNQRTHLAALWEAYTQDDITEMYNNANVLQDLVPVLPAVVNAHAQRLDAPGRPTRTLHNLALELDTTDFPTLFKAFMEREPIYGFGDTQVKKLWEKLDIN